VSGTLFLKLRLAGLIAVMVMVSFSLSSAAVQYVIRKGDNPSSIAKKHKIPLQTLLNANNNVSPKNMKVGTKIVIPAHEASGKGKAQRAKSTEHRADKTEQTRKQTAAKHDSRKKSHKAEAASQASAKPVETTKTASTAGENNLYHVIRKGDTIASLSKKYSISSAELRELNNLRAKKKLKVGQKLLVKRIGPKTYIVRKGDNVWKIAHKFDMDVEDLKALNELDSDELKVGQRLYLEEKVDETNVENYQEILGRNVEEEIRKVAQSEEFTEQKTQDKVIVFAKKMLNIPYKFGGNSILGIDCSAYVKKVYGLMGVELPRTAREQYKTGEAIDRDELSIGDLVFFRTYASFPSHVGIYLGNNLFIHASSKGHKVTIDSLETPYYFKRFIGGKRLLTEAEKEEEPKG